MPLVKLLRPNTSQGRLAVRRGLLEVFRWELGAFGSVGLVVAGGWVGLGAGKDGAVGKQIC